ncbi:hypothetical protein CFH99_07905 [Nocardioides aromaticivorans]|uniref:Transcriptional regulator WhiB n=1 Tax=Nocardioides aromaticivorans TaxID=200618 RepID=A0ABX7PIE1_9ACTN|nr:WhiB family transcriptional regulator [Nocardioides aromaticivorans]QSR25545.1 hypothetical protein CFH99_07905 [Nocardioides aromaticivorans]
MNPFFTTDPIEVDRPTPCYWDPALWFSEAVDNVAEAKRLCGTCPVKARCLADALAQQEKHGVWGGLSASERADLLPVVEEPVETKCRAGFTSGVGTLRRLRALAANGWTLIALAHEARDLGLTESALAGLRRTRSGGLVTTVNADLVATLYARLQGIDGPNDETAKRARNRGWRTPAQWIGRDIDDPNTNHQIGA